MMYRSEKNLIQDLFFPFNLTILALESISGKAGLELADLLRDNVQAYVKQYNNSVYKLAKRVEALTHRVIRDIEDKKKLSGHKFILMLYALAQLVIDEGIYLPEWIEPIFNQFLEIEHNQIIDEEEWIKLKASADKRARKVFNNLQKEGYFVRK